MHCVLAAIIITAIVLCQILVFYHNLSKDKQVRNIIKLSRKYLSVFLLRNLINISHCDYERWAIIGAVMDVNIHGHGILEFF